MCSSDLFSFGNAVAGQGNLEPVLSIDCCHLSGPHRDPMVTVGFDGEGDLVPLTFSLVGGENGESWEYHLEKTKEVLGDSWIIISYRATGLPEMIERVFFLITFI